MPPTATKTAEKSSLSSPTNVFDILFQLQKTQLPDHKKEE